MPWRVRAMIEPSSMLRPPLPRRLANRFLGVRVPYPYRFWVRDDVLGRWYFTRQAACTMTVIILFQTLIALVLPLGFLVAEDEGEYLYMGPDLWLLLIYAAMLGATALLNLVFPRLGRRARRSMLRRHDFHEDGTPILHAAYRLPA